MLTQSLKEEMNELLVPTERAYKGISIAVGIFWLGTILMLIMMTMKMRLRLRLMLRWQRQVKVKVRGI